jgi:hypothetical protein
MCFVSDVMKRFRLSTLLLLVVIAALSLALLEQERRAAQREADLRLSHALLEHILREPVIYRVEGPQVLQLGENSLQALANQFTAVKGVGR